MSDLQGDHLDHTYEVNLETVKKKAVRGIAILVGRGFALNFIAQISQFFLLAFLSPDQMGVFWIVTAAVGFLIYFSDVGLAASLIQKKDKPTSTDLRTTFLIQQFLIITLLILLYLFSPKLTEIYNLSYEGTLLLYAVGFSLFLSSLKTIPSVLLERKLDFGRLTVPELAESLVYSLSAVYFAWQGLGIRSFTYAVLIRGFTGVLIMYIVMPWRPGFAFSKKSIKELLKFGVPYQLNSLIALIKDRGMTLLLGTIIGTSGVGFLGTAERLSQIPLRLVMDSVTKVSFPAFSRMQEHKKELEDSVTRSITFITFLVFPMLIGMLVVAPMIVRTIPKYTKWEPSLFPLMFMVINVAFASVTTQLTNMLAAIGKIKTVSKLITMWAVLTLTIVPALAYFYGVNGASIGYAIVSSSSVIAIYIARKEVRFSLSQAVFKPGLSALLMGAAIFFGFYLPSTFVSIILVILVGGISYLIFSYFILGPSLVDDGKKLFKTFISK